MSRCMLLGVVGLTIYVGDGEEDTSKRWGMNRERKNTRSESRAVRRLFGMGHMYAARHAQ